MRKVKVSMYLTLDGVMDNPAWTAPYFNEEVGKFQQDLLFSSDTLLMGRVTYEGMAAAWPTMTDDVGFCRQNERLSKICCLYNFGKRSMECNHDQR